ncbi:hypothetical protein FACS1894142_6310 [Spirochaetia bacterium]|nr:hypothetical protein FACS1894142_6310 [Spirochaetia bacterium]
MKINPVLLIIALAIAALAAFGFYSANNGEAFRWLITAGAGLSLFVTLSGVLAFSADGGGGTVNIKVTSVLFFIALLVEHIIFSLAGVALTPYVIITGILLLLFVLISYAITRALK